MKTLLVDTNVPATNPKFHLEFPKDKLVICTQVLNELDNLKAINDLAGRNARAFIKVIEQAVLAKSKQIVLQHSESPLTGDDGILEVLSQNDSWILLSNDRNMRLKAMSRKMKVQAYEHKADEYCGIVEISLEMDKFNEFVTKKEMPSDCKFPFQAHWVTEKTTGEGVLGFSTPEGIITLPDQRTRAVWGIMPKNFEQQIALWMLLNQDIKLVTMTGKAGCHRRGEKVLLYSGETKEVQDIQVGDVLIGPDSQPRNVLDIHTDMDTMYEINPKKGEPFFVNGKHILVYKSSNKKELIEQTVEDYVAKFPNSHTHGNYKHVITRSPAVEFSKRELPKIDPYIIGLLLGDGSIRIDHWQLSLQTMDPVIKKYFIDYMEQHGYKIRFAFQEGNQSEGLFVTTKGTPDTLKLSEYFRNLDLGVNTKHIPDEIKYGSIQTRYACLAGLLDTDGYLGNQVYDIIQKNKTLAEDIVFVCRSLGLAAYMHECRKRCVNNNVWGTYFRISISGDTDRIPVKVPYKKANPRKQVKSVLHTGFSVKLASAEERYYGFAVDKDHLYLDQYFNILHNSGKTLLAIAAALHLTIDKAAYDKIIISRPVIPLGKQDIGFLPGDSLEKMTPWMQPIFDNIETLTGTEEDARGKKRPKMMSGEELIKEGILEIAPLAFMRGRSLPQQIVLIDESQNLSMSELKTILTRAGEGTKIILTGDMDQVDVPASQSGLKRVIEAFKTSPIAAHISLQKTERSQLAEEAAERL